MNIADLVRETNQLRSRLGAPPSLTNREFLGDLVVKLRETRHLSRQPLVQCFIEDVTSAGETIRLINTKAHINERRDNHIFSLFEVSYFPSLSLDFLTYTPINVVSDAFAARFDSNTTPVVIDHMSEGFEARVVVALFPENHIDGIQEREDAIFYFIDKFIHRHDRITKKLLEHVVAPSAFPLVREASVQDVEKAASHWVWLHEYFHRKGNMPLPEHLPAKLSKKALSGLEELRVDVAAILACQGECALSARDAKLTAQFILAERLLRYAVEGIPDPNYDAVASQLLFNYLCENGGIFVKDGMIHLTQSLNDVLSRFASRIESIEREVHQHGSLHAERRLFEFVNEYTNYNAVLDEYHHVDFFVDVKRRLDV